MIHVTRQFGSGTWSKGSEGEDLEGGPPPPVQRGGRCPAASEKRKARKETRRSSRRREPPPCPPNRNKRTERDNPLETDLPLIRSERGGRSLRACLCRPAPETVRYLRKSAGEKRNSTPSRKVSRLEGRGGGRQGGKLY